MTTEKSTTADNQLPTIEIINGVLFRRVSKAMPNGVMAVVIEVWRSKDTSMVGLIPEAASIGLYWIKVGVIRQVLGRWWQFFEDGDHAPINTLLPKRRSRFYSTSWECKRDTAEWVNKALVKAGC